MGLFGGRRLSGSHSFVIGELSIVQRHPELLLRYPLNSFWRPKPDSYGLNSVYVVEVVGHINTGCMVRFHEEGNTFSQGVLSFDDMDNLLIRLT